ncbi:MAG: hypothetical protein COX62_02215 [Deltaproteobacteria bacterium CG_4_10_14_0_2_um_filter_43_8]|nr:MAG: hypothetical protein COV43_01885 [Deltaproteobacteria bacterium CG11_big_fil_rev_8_21_14_0_20_42_23]PJA21534.1 MAG: hypothetical protein COX62_02215 [Deltaproteobacteria bacterium CG_4_10_14_0_2_um_filter_43_8]PJC63984.1 MAG: hypothetical protein CO021_06650 [Deltaproteobacteria bacterium CG_4_9_14_0_2_um_filter_42_21]
MKFRKRKKNERGVALMLVLSAITVITVAGIEFAYNTNVNYHLARNHLDRLKASYLAKSAFHFGLLELKYDRVFRQIVEQQNLGSLLGASAQLPLCKQFPLSTGLLRAVFLGGGGLGEGADTEDATASAEEPSLETGGEDFPKVTSLSDEQSAADFLSFEGDFDIDCADESNKLNLNVFAKLKASAGSSSSLGTSQGISEYDLHKQILTSFLQKPEYELLFEDSEIPPVEIVRNIADWTDENRDINEYGGSTGGAESSLYERNSRKYKVKNTSFTTIDEVYQVEGVNEKWFEPLKSNFTIYGDGKINICSVDEGLVQGIIKTFVETTPGVPPVRLADEEVMTRLVSSIQDACSAGSAGDALVAEVTDAFWGALSVDQEVAGNVDAESAKAKESFKNLITATGRYYTLISTGQVADVIVRVKAVVDVKESSPDKWPLLYWKVY